MLKHPEHEGIYNAGFENISIMQIAERVLEHAPAQITVSASNDPRSYRVNSDKLLKAGFKPKKTVNDAIRELVHKFRIGELKDEERFHNLKWMQREVVK
jgi:nucleoside-diphosphate-sugar epimerase